MAILPLVFRPWAVSQPVDRPVRGLPIRTLRPLKPLSVRRRPRRAMRWHLNANGRLTCAWHVVSDTVPACSDEEEIKTSSWQNPLVPGSPPPESGLGAELSTCVRSMP